MTTTLDEAVQALGLSERATWTNVLDAIDKHLADARSHCDEGVLDVLASDAVRAVRDRTAVHDLNLLASDAEQRIAEAEKAKWRASGRAKFEAADTGAKALRAVLDAAAGREQTLMGEGDQPASSRQERLLAQLLDHHAESAAEQWMDARTPDDALARYRAAADDGSERAYVRVFERRFVAGVLDLTAAKDPVGMARAYREAIEGRRAARISASTKAASERLNALLVELDRAAVAVRGAEGVARGMRALGKVK